MAVHSDGDGVLEFAAKPQKPGRRAPRVGFTPRLDLGLPADGAALADFGSLDPTQTGDRGEGAGLVHWSRRSLKCLYINCTLRAHARSSTVLCTLRTAMADRLDPSTYRKEKE